MKLSKPLLALVATAMIAGAAYAEDAPKPEAPKKDKKEMKVRLTKPWSLIESSLTAEQKEKINTIHADTLAKTKELKEKEDTEINAVLTDAQKEELKTALEKDKAAGKAGKEKPAEKAAEKKE